MKLNIAIIQSDLIWEDIKANLDAFGNKISRLDQSLDLIVLPEMFTTGFSMHPEQLAEEVDGPSLAWMKRVAQDKQAVITGSYIVTEADHYYNRLIWMQPDGQYVYYDKHHLFTLAKEHLHYQPGKQKIFPEIQGIKCCPLICYDLRFPVWSSNTNGYDLLIYVASWPNKRRMAWKTLLQARAIENQCYTIGVNRVGTDHGGYEYSGDSVVIDYSGFELMACRDIESTLIAELDFEKQQHFRQKLPFIQDNDRFELLL